MKNKKWYIVFSLFVCVAVVLVLFGPVVILMESPTREQCERMTTKAIFLTVLNSVRTTNLAYVDPWPEFLEKVSEHYYPLQELETRENAEKIITAYIERTENDDEQILKHLKAECLLNHVQACADRE